MHADDADRLGPKGHIYVEMVRAAWRSPLERIGARRAILASVFGAALILVGAIGAAILYLRSTGTLAIYVEAILLVGLGVTALISSTSEFRSLRPEFEEARRLGWVEPSLDDYSVTIGEPATFGVVLHARRALRFTGASLVATAQRYAQSTPGDVLVTLPLPFTLTQRSVEAGADWRQTVTFRIPDTAPASCYEALTSVRWTLTLTMDFDGAASWTRTWPMLVYPEQV